MVCYYGQHYMASVMLNDTLWYMFDDVNVVHIGSVSYVVSKCKADGPRLQFFSSRSFAHDPVLMDTECTRRAEPCPCKVWKLTACYCEGLSKLSLVELKNVL